MTVTDFPLLPFRSSRTVTFFCIDCKLACRTFSTGFFFRAIALSVEQTNFDFSSGIVSAVKTGILLWLLLFHKYILQPFATKKLFKRLTLLKSAEVARGIRAACPFSLFLHRPQFFSLSRVTMAHDLRKINTGLLRLQNDHPQGCPGQRIPKCGMCT